MTDKTSPAQNQDNSAKTKVQTVIVLNDYCYVNGGASRIAVDEAVSHAAAGLKVIFIGACGPVCPELAQANIAVVCLEQKELIKAGKDLRVMLQGLWNFKAAAAMRQILLACDPQHTVVHLHGYTKALTTSPVWAARRAGFQVVCTLHDFFPACPNGGLFDYVENKPCVRPCLSRSCITRNCDKRHYVHKLYRVVRSFVQKYVARFPGQVGHYISISKIAEAKLRPYLPQQAHYYPLENLIEAEQGPLVDVAANKAFVFVGRLDPEKGIDTILAAMRKTNAKVIFVGDGPLRPEVEATPGATVTGWVNGAEVRKQLQNARALLFPSLWYETYGLVVGEAAACGVPAIVSDITAAAERVEHGVHGLHVVAGDVDSLANAFLHMQDHNLAKQMGAAAYARFWNNPPTRSRHQQGLVEIYNRILA